MCLAIPGRIVSVEASPDGDRRATVEYPGERRSASLLYLPEARPGDYVLVQAGFAMRRLTPREAEESLDALAEADARIRSGSGRAVEVAP